MSASRAAAVVARAATGPAPKAPPAPWAEPISQFLEHLAAGGAPKPTTTLRDIRAVQELLGHASVATTQIYTGVDTDAVRRAAFAAVGAGR